ncbi:MAG: glycosyltransferase [Dehalococcoidia bacterium]
MRGSRATPDAPLPAVGTTGGPRPAPPRTAGAGRRPLLSVVVPTCNERDNIVPLVDRLAAVLAGTQFELVFVDDSTDDTPQVIRSLHPRFPVQLIHRPASERTGLTSALVRGLRAARGEYIASIDADLQHPPEKMPEMLAEAQGSGADIIIASRYCAGGSAAGLPGRRRHLVSLGSKWFSRALFYERLRHVSDPGSGFFLLRRSVIEGVDLRPVGYKMLTEILVRGRWSRLEEIPYRFQARRTGASKAGWTQGVQYLHHTFRMFVEVPDVARLWKFLGVGASGIGVNLGLLWVSTSVLGLPPHAGWAIGSEGSILSNFWLNRSFTWRDRRDRRRFGVLIDAGRYHLATAIGVTANFVVFTAAMYLGLMTMAAGLAGVAAGFAANYAGAAGFVFRVRAAGSPDAAELAAAAAGEEAASAAGAAEQQEISPRWL